MGHRSRFGFLDRNNPEAAGECDRCGAIYKLRSLQKQMRYAGSSTTWTGWLVCDRCLDPPHPQDRTVVIPPDPRPLTDARPPTGDQNLLPPYLMAENFAPLLSEGGVFILPE